MMCFQGVWGKPGRWGTSGKDNIDIVWGGAVDSVGLVPAAGGVGVAIHCSRVTFWIPGWGIARDSTIIDRHVNDDVVVVLGCSRCVTGGRGAGWGELRGCGGVLACHWGSLGWQSHFIEQMTWFDE